MLTFGINVVIFYSYYYDIVSLLIYKEQGTCAKVNHMLSQLAKKTCSRWEMMRQAIAMDQLVMEQMQKKPQGLLVKATVLTAPRDKVPTCEML